MNDNRWKRPWLWIGISALVLLLLIGVSFAAFGMFSPRPTPGFYYPFPFSIFWGIFLVFIVFGAFRWMFWGWGWGYPRRYRRYYDSAHQILRERYAKGEITKEQYDQVLRDLDQRE